MQIFTKLLEFIIRVSRFAFLLNLIILLVEYCKKIIYRLKYIALFKYFNKNIMQIFFKALSFLFEPRTLWLLVIKTTPFSYNIAYKTIQYHTIQYNTLQYNKIQYNRIE